MYDHGGGGEATSDHGQEKSLFSEALSISNVSDARPAVEKALIRSLHA
jgi:hypothetical protein